MKKLLIAIALFVTMGITASPANAQISTGTDVLAAAGNLINIQATDVNVNFVDVIDVTNALNGNDVRVLTDILNNLEVDNVLNNLLRNADLIKNNQVVVGVIVNALGEVESVLVARQGQLRKM